MGEHLCLAALLSQVLVAFTVEFDNEFERLMNHAGHPGERLSLAVWLSMLRYVGEGRAVRELATQALAPESQIKMELGCLERWGYVALVMKTSQARGRTQDGWGSGRGIRGDWQVQLTAKGRLAGKIWPPLFNEIEERWEKRFGAKQIGRLRATLEAMVAKLDAELPQGLPASLEAIKKFPDRARHIEERLPISALLSQLLLAFRLEYDRESSVPLPLCANTLRVLSETPIRVAEIPHLTGASPETCGIGWQIKPFVVVLSDPNGKRGKLVRLSQRGLLAQQTYQKLTREIESRWTERFGKREISALRECLLSLFAEKDGKARISEGLIPPQGTVRAGTQAPALGRRDVGSAARQRMRDLVTQTEDFIRDPAGCLPHYPLWDMNRGFGP